MTQTLTIDGMSCEHCVSHVKSALENVDGVQSADVSLEGGTAKVKSDDVVVTDALIQAIRDAGYEARAAD